MSYLLSRGVAEIAVKKDLEKKLRSGKKLRIKFGIDPTGDLLHLGHAVVLLKLKEFQDAGHSVIFLIGDFTARIGDPSGRNKQRPSLSDEQINKNMKSYLEQARAVLDTKNIEVRYNSEWYAHMDLADLIRISARASVTQILHRAEFKDRMKRGDEISVPEILYPILQGYDSVVLRSDVELGGTDQTFNLLMGRQMQERYGQQPQDILMVPILEGLDGKEKMSKTLNNYISLTTAADDMYGKIMSIPDTLIWKYFEYLTRVDEKELQTMSRQIKAHTLNPRDAKAALAREIVSFLHSPHDAQNAELQFIKVFQHKGVPDEMPVLMVPQKNMPLIEILIAAKLIASKAEGRRVIEQGGVAIDGIPVTDHNTVIALSEKGTLIKKGKRSFVKAFWSRQEK
ncbi:tyrosine--tRNA ligase [Candidatus Uhrbacteria bacterium]|nr:tyrosine--tRNA ligase [Candidatus Uhrbacteria bacterium]